MPVIEEWLSAGVSPYVVVWLAAIIEGEVAYIAAAALVAQGHLSGPGVFLAGMLGATIGDQAYFYAFRGRLPLWLARFPALRQRAEPLLERVRRNATLMVVLIRFAPGLRVAMTAACVWADVSAFRFSVLSVLSSIVWAALLLVVIGWLGPAYLERVGFGGWKGALVAGLVVAGVLHLVSRGQHSSSR